MKISATAATVVIKALFLMALLICGGARAASPSVAAGSVWPGVVSYVVDGDTVRVRPSAGGKSVSVRLQGIDAPEICQPGGTLSRDALMRRLLGQRVTVHGRHHDGYGRVLAKVVFSGEDAGKWMVGRGMAWSYRSRGNGGPYAQEQKRARAAKLGVFARTAGAPPVYPAQFRKQHGSCY
ncbi:MAG: thermonuclease family protein [Polaromonas sp.]|uniref:thermonuclease family protein n=1 Tax=Polaromonas sp. TaxID=1869339 RepID=UPI0032672D2D